VHVNRLSLRRRRRTGRRRRRPRRLSGGRCAVGSPSPPTPSGVAALRRVARGLCRPFPPSGIAARTPVARLARWTGRRPGRGIASGRAPAPAWLTASAGIPMLPAKLPNARGSRRSPADACLIPTCRARVQAVASSAAGGGLADSPIRGTTTDVSRGSSNWLPTRACHTDSARIRRSNRSERRLR